MYRLPELAKAPGLLHGISTRGKEGEGNQRYGLEGPGESVTENRAGFLQKVCPPGAGALFKISVEMTIRAGYEEEIRVVRPKWDAGRGMIGTPGIPCEAMMTDSTGLFLYITVGDCLPVIIFDPRKRVLALVHAGRESTVRRIPEKTLQMMREKFGTDPADVLVGMGPGFRSHFLERLPAGINDPLWNVHISSNGHGTFRMNLFGYNHDRLMSAGVPDENIDECPFDTYAHADLFFSHRRSAETGEPPGRHACVVGMVG